MGIYRSGPLSVAALAAAIILILFGCGKGKDVGNKDLLDFEDQKADRLGAAATTTVAPAAPGTTQPPAAQPPVTQKAPPQTAAPQTFFDVGLVPNSPYFEPEAEFIIARGTTLRVTNKDTTPERPDRAFTADDGTFDSGRLKPGQVWTIRLDTPGVWKIVDRNAPFISAKLEVR